jgi:trigger factor
LEYEITVDNECEKELQVRAPAEELEPFIEGEVDELRKKAAVKGYRKGRVPRDLLKSKYRDNIRANALNDLITDAYLKVLKEKNWQPASRVELLNLEEGNPIQFRLRFQVIPDFQIDTYDGLEIMKEQPLPEEFLFWRPWRTVRSRINNRTSRSASATVTFRTKSTVRWSAASGVRPRKPKAKRPYIG